jgi:predicted NUDIX family NTP pyrophosphohydrolase
MKKAAGILLYRKGANGIEVFAAHQGGPFFANKERSWTFPKGEYDDSEDAWDAARREFKEETAHEAPTEGFELTSFVQNGRKHVRMWAAEGDADPAQVKSNHFEIEWPPRSGKKQSFPEMDRAAWFTPEEVKKVIREDQQALVDELLERLEHE